MKIAINLFPISNIGGILTVHNELKKGLEILGHKVDDYYISTNIKSLSTNKYCNNILGFEKNEWLSEYKNVMDDYDLVIFSHPCPTLTKSYTSTKWKNCYKINQKIISIFHDPYIKSHYPWILDVFDDIDLFACIQEKSFYALKPYMSTIFDTRNYKIIGHPINLSDMGKYKKLKENLIISPHQFKSWKYIDKFIEAFINTNNVNIEVFNSGIEFYKMSGKKRDEKYKINNEWIWETALKHGMKYKGFVDLDVLTMAFKRSKGVVDLSVGEKGLKTKYPNLNYAILECVKYGGIPITRDILPKKWEKDINYIAVNDKKLVNSTSKLMEYVIKNFDEYEYMIDNNIKLLKNYYDAKLVAKRLIKYL